MWVLLPLKGFENAKQRLSAVLSQAQRSQLFAAMVEDLIEQLMLVESLAGVAIVSNEPQAKLLAAQWGARFIPEPDSVKGLNAAVEWGLDQLINDASHALVLHGDLPLATKAEISAVVDQADNSITLVPDWQDNGTNGLLAPVPSPINVVYGVDSFNLHSELVTQAAMNVKTHKPSRLAFDVDTAQDLAQLKVLVKDGFSGPRCLKVINSFGLQDKMSVDNVQALELDKLYERLGI
ncbi:MAG: 2-phospho-L-lactate guanylyltransferase [Pseudomonadales bacterium]